MELLTQFISGAITMGYWAIGVFFLRFYKKTKDSLFGVFAASFWVLCVERILLLLVRPENELRPYVYLVRFTAFMLLVVGIIQKNRPPSKRSNERRK
jgi:hypothetical protein